jgi:hypothetical protein
MAQATTTGGVRFGLRLKIAGVTSLAMLIMGSLLGYLSQASTKATLRAEIEKRGRALASNLAVNAKFAVYTNDKKPLRELAKGILAQEDVAYVYFIDAKTKRVLMSGANARDAAKKDFGKGDDEFVGPPDMKGIFDALKLDSDQVKDVVLRGDIDRNDVGHILDVATPILCVGKTKGLLANG